MLLPQILSNCFCKEKKGVLIDWITWKVGKKIQILFLSKSLFCFKELFQMTFYVCCVFLHFFLMYFCSFDAYLLIHLSTVTLQLFAFSNISLNKGQFTQNVIFFSLLLIQLYNWNDCKDLARVQKGYEKAFETDPGVWGSAWISSATLPTVHSTLSEIARP